MLEYSLLTIDHDLASHTTSVVCVKFIQLIILLLNEELFITILFKV